MDILYYSSGLLIALGLPIVCIGIIAALLRPHLINNRSVVKNPMSRKKIASVGLLTLAISFIGFSTVMAVTEPEGVKADRLAREVSTARIEQALQKQRADAKKKADDIARKAEEAKNKPVIKTETKTEAVSFEVTERNDNNLPAGQKKVAVAGVAGERTITYSVTYVHDKEVARTEVKNEITKAPVAQVVLNGTYIKPSPPPQETSCPNGTYVNSARNTV